MSSGAGGRRNEGHHVSPDYAYGVVLALGAGSLTPRNAASGEAAPGWSVHPPGECFRLPAHNHG